MFTTRDVEKELHELYHKLSNPFRYFSISYVKGLFIAGIIRLSYFASSSVL